MPHRIHWFSESQIADPLIDFGDHSFELDFESAGELLRLWRNPHLGRSSREGTILSLASKNDLAIRAISERIRNIPLTAEQEQDLINKYETMRFMGEKILPDALEKVNRDELLTKEELLEFIENYLKQFENEHKDIKLSREVINQLESIIDIELVDAFGRKKRIARDEVMDYIGRILGNILVKQFSLQPVDRISAKPRGKLLRYQTFRQASLREAQVPPKSIKQEDIRVIERDRKALVYFILDISQSMGRKVFEGDLTRLDGALLTSLGLFYYFNLINRRKRREKDTFTTHLVPFARVPTVIESKDRLQEFILSASAKGRTPMAPAVHAAINHAMSQYSDRLVDVNLVIVTDGRPNESLGGHWRYLQPATTLANYFEKSGTSTPPETVSCMLELNGIFRTIKRQKTRNWNISYFLMAPEQVLESDIYRDTTEMLKDITRVIRIDPSNIADLGRQILMESLLNE
jgi:hypothetical protein